jgi:prepilin-type N-terminal cleavage/methylation domain-containing protein
MKKRPTRFNPRSAGFSLLEVLISLGIVGVCAAGFLTFQTTSWANNNAATMTLSAGQLIERQVEYLRMIIASNPDTFAVYLAVNKQDSTSAKNINVRWVVANSMDQNNVPMPDARLVTFTAAWTKPRKDSLVVPACISKNF